MWYLVFLVAQRAITHVTPLFPRVLRAVGCLSGVLCAFAVFRLSWVGLGAVWDRGPPSWLLGPCERLRVLPWGPPGLGLRAVLGHVRGSVLGPPGGLPGPVRGRLLVALGAAWEPRGTSCDLLKREEGWRAESRLTHLGLGLSSGAREGLWAHLGDVFGLSCGYLGHPGSVLAGPGAVKDARREPGGMHAEGGPSRREGGSAL